MPCGISSVGASSTLITVMVSLSENGSLYPFSTDFSGGTSGDQDLMVKWNGKLYLCFCISFSSSLLSSYR